MLGQWHPKAGARALNCGWISCCFAAPASLHLCPMRRPVAFFVAQDDLLARGCRQIGDHGAAAAIIDATLTESATTAPATISTRPQDRTKVQAPDDPPDDPGVHF
ncbi:MAG: hypothetical protein GDA36_07040 [Rhodobacteraceae bacterium]|nr:hypothetical protein [Paracoccaceae bacterium]